MTPEEKASDPGTSGEELLEIWESCKPNPDATDTAARLTANANCPISLFDVLLSLYPAQAMQNLAFQLEVLAQPARALEFVRIVIKEDREWTFPIGSDLARKSRLLKHYTSELRQEDASPHRSFSARLSAEFLATWDARNEIVTAFGSTDAEVFAAGAGLRQIISADPARRALRNALLQQGVWQPPRPHLVTLLRECPQDEEIVRCVIVETEKIMDDLAKMLRGGLCPHMNGKDAWQWFITTVWDVHDTLEEIRDKKYALPIPRMPETCGLYDFERAIRSKRDWLEVRWSWRNGSKYSIMWSWSDWVLAMEFRFRMIDKTVQVQLKCSHEDFEKNTKAMQELMRCQTIDELYHELARVGFLPSQAEMVVALAK